MAIGAGLNFATKSLKSPLSDFATRLDSFGSGMVAQADKDELLKQEKERLAIQDARQASQDAQNKQLFDLKMEDAAMAKKKIADKSAFLKGISQPDAYGLRYGTNDIVNRLGQYSGDNPEAKAALAAGPGTVEYDNYFKKMEALGNGITSNSYEDRVMGFSTANPSNEYAAEEAIKANIARASALDKEIKSVGDNKLKYDLEMLKQVGKSGTKNSSSTGKTTGGYSVKDPGTVSKDAYTIVKNAYGKKAGDKIDATVNKQIAIMADAGYDAAQISKVIMMAHTPGEKNTFWFDKDSNFDSTKAAQAVGAPRNVAVETATTNAAYTAGLGKLSSSYDDRLKSLKEQKDGKVGMSMLDNIINGSSTKPTVNDVVNKANGVKERGTLTERTNNPGAIKNASQSDKSVMWKGQTGYDNQGHAVFDTLENGFRAQAVNLNTQINRKPTVEELIKGNKAKGISAYATGNQNEYVKFISDKLGVDKNYYLKPSDIPRLLKAQAQFEGSAFNEKAANTGFNLAVKDGKISVSEGREKQYVEDVKKMVEKSFAANGEDKTSPDSSNGYTKSTLDALVSKYDNARQLASQEDVSLDVAEDVIKAIKMGKYASAKNLLKDSSSRSDDFRFGLSGLFDSFGISNTDANQQDAAMQAIAAKVKSGDRLSSEEGRWYRSMQSSPSTRKRLQELGL